MGHEALKAVNLPQWSLGACYMHGAFSDFVVCIITIRNNNQRVLPFGVVVGQLHHIHAIHEEFNDP